MDKRSARLGKGLERGGGRPVATEGRALPGAALFLRRWPPLRKVAQVGLSIKKLRMIIITGKRDGFYILAAMIGGYFKDGQRDSAGDLYLRRARYYQT